MALINLPNLKLPQLNLPQVKLPEIRLPDMHLAIITAEAGHRALITINDATIETLPLEHLVYYVGIAGLVGLNVMELPVAAALVIGHLLIGLTRRPGLESLGEVIEEA